MIRPVRETTYSRSCNKKEGSTPRAARYAASPMPAQPKSPAVPAGALRVLSGPQVCLLLPFLGTCTSEAPKIVTYVRFTSGIQGLT